MNKVIILIGFSILLSGCFGSPEESVRPCITIVSEPGFETVSHASCGGTKVLSHCVPCTRASSKEEQTVCRGYVDLVSEF